MTHPIQQNILNILQGDWAEYIGDFRRLPPHTQADFLAKQGYVRFADLLAHIAAWWQAGYSSIERYLSDPAAQPTHYDVDTFNAQAVAAVAGQEEAQVIASFETLRVFLADFVRKLPEASFEDQRIVDQLNMDVAGHLGEHRLPGK